MPLAVSVLHVSRIEERHQRVYVSGYGDTALFDNESLGWFAVFLENNLAIKVGLPNEPPPDLKSGDQIRMTLERTT